MDEQESLRYADLEIRPGRRQVLRAGQPVVLGARAFDLLLALAARPGRLRTKDELVEAVWAGAPIGDNNLVVQIGLLRKALGPGCITTVPGKGYQWTAGAPQAPGSGMAGATEIPLRSSSPAAADGGLVGRAAELAWMEQALRRPVPGVLNLIGPAGIGKTALARAVARRLSPAPGKVAACIVELAGLPPLRPGREDDADPGAVVAALGAAIGATLGASREPVTELVNQVRHRAAAQALPPLVVLDNCEHVLAAVRSVVGALAAVPGLRLMLTSQVPLKIPEEVTLRLEPLALPSDDNLAGADASAAVRLFCARAGAADPQFALQAANAAAIADICRRLDGVPLALELAAGRVALLGVDGLRAHMDERFRLLRNRDAALARHQTLHAALDWSHGLLRPAEQAVLRRLATFAGGFTAASAQDVAQEPGLDAWAVLDVLGALVDRSLVSRAAAPPAAAGETGAPRFILLESVRAYARDRLHVAGEAVAVGRRHAEHFLALAEAHGGGVLAGAQAQARRSQVPRELDNLRAAMAWCLEHDPRLGLRLAAALALFWREQGLLSEGRKACAALLAQTSGDPPGPARIAVQVTLGALAMEQDDAAQMQAMGEQVLQASRAIGERRREAHARGLLAHAANTRNDMAHARSHFEEALVIYRRMNDPRTIAETLNNLASCRLSEGRCDLALALLEEALPLARSSGHGWTEAAILQTTGDVHHALGELGAAEAPLVESLRLRRVNGHAQQVVMSLQSLALLYLRQGRLDAARDPLAEAASACSARGYGQLDGLCLLGAGAWAVATGRAAEARPLLVAAREQLLGTPIGCRPHVARILDEAWACVGASASPEAPGGADPAGHARTRHPLTAAVRLLSAEGA